MILDKYSNFRFIVQWTHIGFNLGVQFSGQIYPLTRKIFFTSARSSSEYHFFPSRYFCLQICNRGCLTSIVRNKLNLRYELAVKLLYKLILSFRWRFEPQISRKHDASEIAIGDILNRWFCWINFRLIPYRSFSVL